METTVSSKGQIVLPAEIRRLDRVRAGEKFEVERLDCGEYRLKRVAPRPNQGLVELLLACPARGWFAPLPRVETTDDVKAPGLR
jgi:AbrB family looped-hinge helix DNA binding protein